MADTVRLIATVPSGLETLAVAEFKKFPYCVAAEHSRRGKIEVTFPVEHVLKIREMRSIDNIFVVVDTVENFLEDDAEKGMCLNAFEDLSWQMDFKKAIAVWRSFLGYQHDVYVAEPFPAKPSVLPLPTAARFPRPARTKASPTSAVADPEAAATAAADAKSSVCSTASDSSSAGATVTAHADDVTATADGERHAVADGGDGTAAAAVSLSSLSLSEAPPLAPSFRATCNRVGMNHSFSSMDVARAFGGAINDHHHWTVQMVDSDMDVIVNVIERKVEVCVAVTRESLHKRNIAFFGPTTLRSTICNGLLRLADVQPGEVVCDPMCGGASIPLEGYMAFPHGAFLGGDNHDVGCEYSGGNVRALSAERAEAGKGAVPVDICRWDVCELPLRTGCVDAFISDLPFGKRIGSAANNKVLYPKLFKEMARVCRANGRAVILSLDKRTLIRTISNSPFWKMRYTRTLNIGGLPASVYYVVRNDKQ